MRLAHSATLPSEGNIPPNVHITAWKGAAVGQQDCRGFTMSGLLLSDGVGDVRVPGTGQLGVQDCPGDLQHSSLGHPHQGIAHQPGTPGTLQAGDSRERLIATSAMALPREKTGSRRVFWNFLGILPWLCA